MLAAAATASRKSPNKGPRRKSGQEKAAWRHESRGADINKQWRKEGLCRPHFLCGEDAWKYIFPPEGAHSTPLLVHLTDQFTSRRCLVWYWGAPFSLILHQSTKAFMKRSGLEYVCPSNFLLLLWFYISDFSWWVFHSKVIGDPWNLRDGFTNFYSLWLVNTFLGEPHV